MVLISGASSQPQQAYSNKVLEGETIVSASIVATPLPVANSIYFPYTHIFMY